MDSDTLNRCAIVPHAKIDEMDREVRQLRAALDVAMSLLREVHESVKRADGGEPVTLTIYIKRDLSDRIAALFEEG